MSDTPRTDAIYPVELLDRGIKEHGRTWGWGVVSDFRDLARQLERELNEAKIGAARYEYVRKLNSRQYGALIRDCMTWDLNFDAEVDRRRSQK